jgi:hypothetical protein
VPVYVSNEDYEGPTPAVAAEEAKALQRIYHDALKEKRSAGSVCVYLQTPDGKGISSQTVAGACQPGRFLKMLEEAIDKVKPQEGEPLTKPGAQSVAPKRNADSLLFYLVSRYDHRGSWGEFPAENWLVVKQADWSKWLPADAVKPGQSWELSREPAAQLLTYFFPQTEVCNFARLTEQDGLYKHRIEKQKLTARVLSIEGDRVRVRMDGQVRIKHRFYPHRDDQNVAEAGVLGYFEFDAARKTITTLRLVTDQATYGGHRYTVAVNLVP